MAGFWHRKSNRQNEPRCWNAVQDLIARLSLLADERYGGRREFHMWTTPERTSITIKIKGNDFSGEGQSPWEAAANLAAQASSLSVSITDILDDEASDTQVAA